MKRVEAALEHTLHVEQGRVRNLEEQLQQTMVDRVKLIQEQKKGESWAQPNPNHNLNHNSSLNNTPHPITSPQEIREHAVASHQLVQESEQTDVARAITVKKALRSEATLQIALALEKERVLNLQEELGAKNKAGFELARERKKGKLLATPKPSLLYFPLSLTKFLTRLPIKRRDNKK